MTSETVSCPSCGAVNEEGRFCNKCGTNLEAARSKPQSPLFCPSCGTKLDESTVFCGSCGLSVTGTQSPASSAPPAFASSPIQKEKNAMLVLNILLMLSIPIIMLVTFLSLQGYADDYLLFGYRGYGYSEVLNDSGMGIPLLYWIPAVLMTIYGLTVSFVGYSTPVYKSTMGLNSLIWIPISSFIIVTISVIVSLIKIADSYYYEEVFTIAAVMAAFGFLFLFPHCFTIAGMRRHYQVGGFASGMFIASAVLLFLFALLCLLAGFAVMGEGAPPVVTTGCFISCFVWILLGGLVLTQYIVPSKTKMLERAGG